MAKLVFVAVSVLAVWIQSLQAAEPATQAARAKMSDRELAAVRDGFDQRVRQAFEAQRGKPLVRAAKRAPLGPDRGNYVRHYSWSIVDYATRCLALGEQIEQANAALVENAQHYFDNPKDVNDRDSFHWHSEMLCRLIEMYGPKGTAARGRLTDQTQNVLMEQLWCYAKWKSTFAEADTANTWRMDSSENHHAQAILTCWHYAKLAKDLPDFKDRKYDDGHTAADHYAAWTKYLKVYCAERGKKGVVLEIASDGYNVIWMKGFLNVFDFADDAVLRRRVGAMLDLYWALWAQEQIDGVRGGGKTRIYQTGGDRQGDSELRDLAWFYFGIGQARAARSPLLAMLTSAYRPPLVVIDMALDVQGRGRYEIHQRPPGLVEPGYGAPGDLRLLVNDGGIHRYSWATPEFILGCLMFRNRPRDHWAAISSQNRWHGVIFAGDVDARIVPQVRSADDHTIYNAQWALQSKGTLICQKTQDIKRQEMRVWFAKSLLGELLKENGWLFVKAAHAYAAVRVVQGDAAWDVRPPSAGPGTTNPASQKDVAIEKSSGSGVPMVKRSGAPGAWLLCQDNRTPIIIEVASQGEFATYEAFRKAVAALPVTLKDGLLTCTGLSGDQFSFHADYSGDPAVNGKPVDYAPPMAFDSPFVRSNWNTGVVTITKDGRTLVLDFNQE